MNKLHEKYYIPLEKLHEGENELDYNYKYFCAEFENYANPKRNKEFNYENGNIEIDLLKDETIGNRIFVQHYFHRLAKTLNIDRGDFAKVNNLEGLKGWYEMILEYRKRIGVDKEVTI
ncbi:MAG: hypothetical protein NC548_15630 [Lachnospiraceae bacterium]|nr:hypothetical protein [Lachnospiraceae bacterium]